MPDWFGDFVLQFGVAVLGGFVAGRLLGIRLSWGRWLLALVVGVTAGGTIAWLVAGSPRDPIISVQLLDDATGERTTPLEVLGYCGLIGSVILTLRVLVDVLRTDR